MKNTVLVLVAFLFLFGFGDVVGKGKRRCPPTSKSPKCVVEPPSPEPQAPIAPSALAAVATSLSGIDLSWADNSDNELGFRLERCLGVGCFDFTQIAGLAENSRSFSDSSGLNPDTAYNYRVLAFNDVGDSGYSNTAQAITDSEPDPDPEPDPSPEPDPTEGCVRPYSDTSPWNTPIRVNPVIHRDSDAFISVLTGFFGSDPNQYTYPVYFVTDETPLRQIALSGPFSNVTGDGDVLDRRSGLTVLVPIPAGAIPSIGNDQQIILWNQATGDEWGFIKFTINSDGSLSGRAGYHYNTNWSGVPPLGFMSRGAGVTYLAGLMRPCEFAQGFIPHAIAFAYDYPTPEFIFPATKSDGKGVFPDMPEGTRLQLDPALADAEIEAWGCTGSCLIIARAFQAYGMYVIDNSGHPKAYPEFEATAHWGEVLHPKTVTPIPLSSFRAVEYDVQD